MMERDEVLALCSDLEQIINPTTGEVEVIRRPKYSHSVIDITLNGIINAIMPTMLESERNNIIFYVKTAIPKGLGEVYQSLYFDETEENGKKIVKEKYSELYTYDLAQAIWKFGCMLYPKINTLRNIIEEYKEHIGMLLEEKQILSEKIYTLQEYSGDESAILQLKLKYNKIQKEYDNERIVYLRTKKKMRKVIEINQGEWNYLVNLFIELYKEYTNFMDISMFPKEVDYENLIFTILHNYEIVSESTFEEILDIHAKIS